MTDALTFGLIMFVVVFGGLQLSRRLPERYREVAGFPVAPIIAGVAALGIGLIARAVL